MATVDSVDSPMPSIDLSGYPPLLKIKEVQDIMRCSEQTVRWRMRRGRLSYHKGENAPLILRKGLRRYREERLAPAVDECAATRRDRS
jgi:hypothetical protein